MVSERLKRFWKKFKNWLGKNEEKMEDEESTPIFEEDRPLTEFFKDSEDLLNRKFFAEDLAEVLLKHLKHFSPCSFSIGIYGKWGSGKTSLLNMVLKFVKDKSKYQDPKPIIVQFNPWLCSDWQQMISQFFKQLAYEIKLKRPKEKAVWETIAEYGDMFEFANLIPTVGPILAALGKVTTLCVRSKIKKIDNSLQKQKDKIIDSLTKKSLKDDLKIIVTIDDIDRLTKEEIIAVFQLVKNLADFPNTVYLLAFDYNIVVKALEDVQCNHGKDGNGKEYLEKIIQVPFQIPYSNIDTIHNAFLKKIETISGKNINETLKETALLNDGIKPYIKSLRDLNRFANVFYLKYLLLSEETDLTDLLGLTCLQVFEPYLYSNLPKEKELLSENHYFANGTKDHLKNELTKFFNNVTINREISARLILGCLFPVVDNVFDLNTGAKFYNRDDLLWGKKIAAEACFDRYFSLNLEENAIESSVLNKMIMEMSYEKLTQKLKDYNSGKINRFINELIAFVNAYLSPDLPEKRVELLVRIIIEQWDFLIRNTNPDLINRLLKNFLEKFKTKINFGFLSELFENSKSNLSALDNLLCILFKPYKWLEDKDHQLLSLEKIKSLSKIFIERSISTFNNCGEEEPCNNFKYLRDLEQFGSDPTIIIEEIAYLICHCVKDNDSNNSRYWIFNSESFERFIPINSAVSHVKRYVQSEDFFTLSEEIKKNIVVFLLLCEQPKPEKEAVSEEQIIKELKRLEEERKQK